MTIETATYINGLNATYPTSTDLKSEGDDHIRLVKSTVKATFPNVSGAVNASHTELNELTGTTPLTALVALATNGMVAKTASNTFVTRTLSAGAGVTISNGDGVAGNPTIAMSPTIGAGDMLGPVSSVSGNIPTFNGTSGKILQDGGVAAPTSAVVGITDTQNITNKTFGSGNTWQGNVTSVTYGGTGAATLTGMVKGNGTSAFSVATAETDYVTPSNSGTLTNKTLASVAKVSLVSETVLSTTTGAVTIDWSANNNQKQNEPTGAITYTFTAPAGPCHLQLRIDSDGTSTAQVITWPASVKWIGYTWSGINNKAAIINFWYDGASYWAAGNNQV